MCEAAVSEASRDAGPSSKTKTSGFSLDALEAAYSRGSKKSGSQTEAYSSGRPSTSGREPWKEEARTRRRKAMEPMRIRTNAVKAKAVGSKKEDSERLSKVYFQYNH
jgi:hypothetical protein